MHTMTNMSISMSQREYVYNKPVVVKGADGREMHKTFKLKTPHQETHAVYVANRYITCHACV